MATTKIDNPNLFDFSSLNTALQLPTGDTASRPSSPSTGEWRYNNELKYVEYYDGGMWRQIDTETLPIADDFPEQNFNVSTYVGTGAALTLDAKFDQAAVLNGSNSSIDFAPNKPVIFPDTTGGTLSFWIKPNTVSTNQDIFATSPNGGWGAPYGQLIRLGSNGKMQLYQYSTSGGNALNNNPLETSVLTAGVWTHVALSYEGNSINDTIQFYINGSPDGSTYLTAASPMGNSSYNLQVRIGYRNDGGIQNPYDGAIDQVRIYHSQLSNTDVSNLYNNETATTASSLNFPSGKTAIATYQFNGNPVDLSGNYNGHDIGIGYTGLQFQPDFIWTKNQGLAEPHMLYDSVRGVEQTLYSNDTDTQYNDSGSLTGFNSNGFSVGTYTGTNRDGYEFVAWCFKGGGNSNTYNIDGTGYGTASAAGLNTGTITPTGASINTESRFSIVTYTGNAAAGATVDHGLGVVPNLVITKGTTGAAGATNWNVYTSVTGATKKLVLNTTDAEATGTTYWNDTAPTSTVFSLGTTGDSNYNGSNYVAYCFADKAGYQKIGSYTGNDATSPIYGQFVTTGFEPAFLIVKNSTTAGNNWALFDNKRTNQNLRNKALFPNENVDNYTTSGGILFASNGFQVNSGDNFLNADGDTFVYLAIAANVQSTPSLSKSFKALQYTGNASSQTISGLDFRTDFLFNKTMGANQGGFIFDSTRTRVSSLYPVSTYQDNPNSSVGNDLVSFNYNGISIGPVEQTFINSAYTQIIWAWKATQGMPTFNTDGSVTTILNANQAAGFSFLKWKGTGAQATLGHGLSSAPELIISKNLTNANNWSVYSSALGLSHTSYPNWLYFNLTSDEQYSGSSVNHPYYQAPSTSLIYQNTGTSESTNVNGDLYISYCFHSVSGYSKVGSYTGNGTSLIVYTTDDGTSGGANGFQPDFVLVKRYDSSSSGNWVIVDSVRGVNYQLYANLTNQNNYDTNGVQSFNSNGFTVGSGSDFNASSGTYIYLAIKFN